MRGPCVECGKVLPLSGRPEVDWCRRMLFDPPDALKAVIALRTPKEEAPFHAPMCGATFLSASGGDLRVEKAARPAMVER